MIEKVTELKEETAQAEEESSVTVPSFRRPMTLIRMKRDIKSPGEERFESITYHGIGWLVTAGLGIGLAQVLERGSGRAVFDKAIHYFTPKYQSLMHVSEETARQAVSSGLTHASFITGASIPVYPIKKLEDNKADIVAAFDQQINEKRIEKGDPPTAEELKIQQQAYERIKAAPNQTWPSLLTGRALGVSSVFFPAIFLVKGADKRLLENVAEKITPNKQLQSLGVLTTLEVGYSFISEEVLHFASHLYAEKRYGGDASHVATIPKPSSELSNVDSLEPHETYQGLSFRA